MEPDEKDFEQWWEGSFGLEHKEGMCQTAFLKTVARDAWKQASQITDKHQFRKFDDSCRQTRWDKRYLELARHVASWSKDPSTKTGAVITAPDGRVVSVGYNGFAKGVDDTPERYNDRDLKYKMIVHCERNAILFAKRDLAGCTLYTWPFMSCSVCAAMVIQAGIKRCVAPPVPPHLLERWGHDMNVLATTMFNEAGVEVVTLDL